MFFLASTEENHLAANFILLEREKQILEAIPALHVKKTLGFQE